MKPDAIDSRKLSDRYPGVERLMLFVAFEEADAEAEPNYQQIIFTADSAADFRLDCSREECRDGGFDYGPAIDALLRSGEERAQGTIVCGGVLGSGGEHGPCALRSEYRIIIQYRS